jgi:hypothetical protein
VWIVENSWERILRRWEVPVWGVWEISWCFLVVGWWTKGMVLDGDGGPMRPKMYRPGGFNGW